MNAKKQIETDLKNLSLEEKVNYINDLREFIHQYSPFKNEPVDFVKWVKSDSVTANDYNPNKVAPPEMELLEISIMNDGYTQPIVTYPYEDKIEVIDGFHRNRVGKESKIVNQRIHGFLPTVIIRKEQTSKNDRIASTIRHNRARGKHQINAMSEIVIDLKNRNWTNQRIAKQLGMDEEEVLRLCQISGLEHLFSNSDFSNAWESSDYSEEFEPLSDEVSDVMEQYKIPNESDEIRIYHTYDKWECHKAGFYNSKKEGYTNEQCENEYLRILSNEELFSYILEKLIIEWKYSCEHYLTNSSMNRIAWLGQAAVCYETGVPSCYSGSWSKLSDEQQTKANNVALKYLNKWLDMNKGIQVSIEEGLIINRQVELY
jgi:hypothetical protein